jgi:hypothetical protein
LEKGNTWLAGKCGKMEGGEMIKKDYVCIEQ